MKLKHWILSILLIALTFGLIAVAGYALNDGQNHLTSIKTKQVPELDGKIEDLWDQAPELKIPVQGGRSGPTTVTFKSMYTDTDVYFLAQWDDNREDLDRMPWDYDGKEWKRKPGGGSHYEDKFSVYWNINDSTTGFNEKGCMATCHGEKGATKYGAHRTNGQGQLIDQWHWKGARTGPAGQIDDQYVNWLKQGELDAKGKPSKEAGRYADPKKDGGYEENIDEKTKKLPIYMFKDPEHPMVNKSFIMKEEAVPFADNGQFKKGDRIPGHVVAPFTGDRGDIPAKGLWKDGKWTLEWSRKLSTGSKYDVDFSNLNRSYPFGVATFNNEQWDHSYSLGVFQLVFKK